MKQTNTKTNTKVNTTKNVEKRKEVDYVFAVACSERVATKKDIARLAFAKMKSVSLHVRV